MLWGRWIGVGRFALVVLVGWGVTWLWASAPKEEVNRRPSTYAPAKDLEFQIEHLMQRIKGDLEDASRYERRVKRVLRDANTIAVLAMVMAHHDEPHRLRDQALGVLEAARVLAAKASRHADAVQAYEKLVAATTTPSAAQTVAWGPVANIEHLMLQIPELDRSLKAALKPSSFSATRQEAASLASTIAAISHMSLFDDTYCKDNDDREAWIELCTLMRDAAADVHAAIEQGNLDAAQRALRPLTRTCTDCHEHFGN